MQMKCVSVILFLTMLTLCSCGPESMLHKAVDAVAGAVPLPATITNVMKSALKQAIHKGGKYKQDACSTKTSEGCAKISVRRSQVRRDIATEPNANAENHLITGEGSNRNEANATEFQCNANPAIDYILIIF
uniref:Venom peptide HtC4Tx3 n=1 Tax=Hadogenes troglodytes TaxID=1577150 RepID=A0A1B3IJ05_9SCOR|nr:venom peptide HtC4Tx3 [Hadogenes troglodytes]